MALFSSISGYHLSQKIYEGSRTLVYRGTRQADQRPVVIKLLKNPYPTFSELVQFRNQYTIGKNLKIPGIVRPYSLESYQNGYALVMEDFSGVSLRNYISENTLDLRKFLTIALQLTDILDGLYKERVIHKDIKPANILINPQNQQIKLIDFSIASLLPKETQEILNPNILEGTLAYLSPEQTGRMNRGIDYRADFYALGVTFYELLTGKLPFATHDAMELLHCHIAKYPPLVSEINSEIPLVISKIVEKLMAKNAEERYQSALGIKHDFENCLHQLQNTGNIAEFAIAKRDISDSFVIPEKLYGREAEVETLFNAFARVAKGAVELILVSGFSGIGKTAVVNEVHKPIVREKGYFIKGKFDQFQRDIPLFAFVQAFRNLMSQLLSETDLNLQKWKEKILAALGENGRVIIEVIPELENIIRQQPFVAELSGTAAQNRFNLLFQKFVRVFTTKEHPLVMFFDDLQWADSASLNLIKLLMSDTESGYLLIIGAYRDNEVFPAHPLMLMLDDILQKQAIIQTINLIPLKDTHVYQLIAETFNCTIDLVLPLGKLVYNKTKGNPFFIRQFLKALYSDKLINFNCQHGYWFCDIAEIKAQSLTDDVVEFMALQLQNLPSATQTILQLAACIGNQFDLQTLAIVSQQPETEVGNDLWSALQSGLILPTSEIYKFYQSNDDIDQIPVNNYQLPNYKFLHDRVQQAAYLLIPEEKKQLTHLKIGELLLSNISNEQREDKIFEIINQLNYSAELISEEQKRDELAYLNLTAAQKARSATAYIAAKSYTHIGIELLGKNGWERQYNTTLSLYELAAEVAYLNGDELQMELLIDAVIENTRSFLEQVNVYRIKIQANSSQNKFQEAMNLSKKKL